MGTVRADARYLSYCGELNRVEKLLMLCMVFNHFLLLYGTVGSKFQRFEDVLLLASFRIVLPSQRELALTLLTNAMLVISFL